MFTALTVNSNGFAARWYRSLYSISLIFLAHFGGCIHGLILIVCMCVFVFYLLRFMSSFPLNSSKHPFACYFEFCEHSLLFDRWYIAFIHIVVIIKIIIIKEYSFFLLSMSVEILKRHTKNKYTHMYTDIERDIVGQIYTKAATTIVE